jgi:hypothetical protein
VGSFRNEINDRTRFERRARAVKVDAVDSLRDEVFDRTNSRRRAHAVKLPRPWTTAVML